MSVPAKALSREISKRDKLRPPPPWPVLAARTYPPRKSARDAIPSLFYSARWPQNISMALRKHTVIFSAARGSGEEEEGEEAGGQITVRLLTIRSRVNLTRPRMHIPPPRK